MKVRNHLLSMILAVAACKSTEDPGGGSGRVDGGPRRGRDCKVDRNNKPEEAVALTLGQRLMDETYVCPQTDVDWYSFQLPVGQPLLTVQLTFPIGSTSPVELAYDIFAASDTTTPITGGRDEVPGDNRSMLTRVHALDGAGGAYFL